MSNLDLTEIEQNVEHLNRDTNELLGIFRSQKDRQEAAVQDAEAAAQTATTKADDAVEAEQAAQQHKADAEAAASNAESIVFGEVDEVISNRVQEASAGVAAGVIRNALTIEKDYEKSEENHQNVSQRVDQAEQHIDQANQEIDQLKTADERQKETTEQHFLQLKKLALAVSSAVETHRSWIRENGQDGVYRVKMPGNADLDDNAGLTHHDGYSLIASHSHWDHGRVNGLAQFIVIIGGVPVQMRHTDYHRMQPMAAGGGYLTTETIDYPSVPVDMTGSVEEQVEKAKQYLLAREDESLRAGLADFAGAHQVYAVYAELIPEVLDASELETMVGSRHQLNSDNHQDALDEFVFWDWSGLQDPQQNYNNFPLIARGLDADGNLAFGQWKARVVMAPIGSYEDYPLHRILNGRDDLVLSQRYAGSLSGTRHERFEIPSELRREIAAKIPGLDGYGASIDPTFSVGGQTYSLDEYRKPNTPLNAAYYYDAYSLRQNDADGRVDKYTGFSRQSFVAENTRPEVLQLRTGNNYKRISKMHILELCVVDFRQNWNPQGIADLTDQPTGGNPRTMGLTADNPVAGYQEDTILYYHTPPALFSAEAETDPADTASTTKWMLDSTGTAVQQAPSGVPIFLPPINGKTLRQRYPVYDVYDHATVAYRTTQAIYQQQVGLTAAIIRNATAIAKRDEV